MNHSRNYTTIADLLTDDSFLTWHLTIDSRCIQLRKSWIAENKTHARLAKNAVQLLSTIMAPATALVPGRQINAAFDRLYNKITQLENDILPHR